MIIEKLDKIVQLQLFHLNIDKSKYQYIAYSIGEVC